MSAAESGAADGDETGPGSVEFPEVPFQNRNDPALRLLVEVWDELSDSVKNRILKLANNSVATVR